MDAPKSTAGRPELEDWSVESEIGSGGCGTVYVVRHRQTGDRAALKVPAAWHGGEGTAAEISALASMKHQHVVDLVGTIRTDQGDAILMEYLPGGSVADLVSARGPLSLGEAVTVIAPIAGALAFLHEHGGVHGDVAPGNVLFTAAGMPKLADLGLAVLVGGLQSESGTPGFRAPTLAGDDSGGKRLRPARDVFSLAALTWYMVTGRVAGPTQQRPPLSSLLGRVPSQLVELLEDGLSEDESRRPSAAEFGRRIFEVAKPQPVSLRDAVRPEGMPHMVTHVVAGQPAARGPGPWKWLRARVDARRNEIRPARRRARGRAKPVWPDAAGTRGGRPRERSRGVRTRHRRPAIWLASMAVVLLAGLGAVGVGALNQQQAASPTTAAGKRSQQQASTVPRVNDRQEAAPSPTSGSDATHPRGQVLKNAAFREPVPDDPLEAARVLSSRRDLALSAADAPALRQVHARRSSSLGPDLAKASQLRAQGLHYEGLATRLSDATVRDGADRDTVEVVVTSTIGSYQVVGADGAIVATIDHPEIQRVTLRLARDDHGWLIAGVLDASETGKKTS